MLSLQAVHSPLQAPEVDIRRYEPMYRAGWEKIRAARDARQVEAGLMPAGLTLPRELPDRAWHELAPDEQHAAARKMAVFAAMRDHADRQLGRLQQPLRATGQLDNTVFIAMSDNGADAYDLSQLNQPMKLWYRAHFALGTERMGGKGSYVHHGVDWAEVSNTPFAGFKGTSLEGGMRVPSIVSLPGGAGGGRTTDAFACATDLLPTVLDLAGIALPGDTYAGKALHRPTGRSLLPLLKGDATRVHGADEPIGFEGSGGQALFLSEYKLLRNGAPYPDPRWKLIHLHDDPTEARDLSAREPERLKAMLAEVEADSRRRGVVLPEAGYDPLRQLLRNNWPVLVRQLWSVLLPAALLLLAVPPGLGLWWRRRARRVEAALDA